MYNEHDILFKLKIIAIRIYIAMRFELNQLHRVGVSCKHCIQFNIFFRSVLFCLNLLNSIKNLNTRECGD